VSRYWEVRSYLTEGYEQFQALLPKIDSNVPAEIRAKAELGAGRLSWCQDRDEDALRHFHNSKAIYEELGRREQVGIIEAFLGFTQRNDGNNTAAREHFERARAIGEALQSRRLLLISQNGLGSLAGDDGDFARAREVKEKSLAGARILADHWIVSLVSGSLGRLCFLAGDYTASRNYIREALTIARELGNKWAVPYAIEGLADICAKENQGFKAVRLYGAASVQREALALAFSPTETDNYKSALSRLHAVVPDAEMFDREWQAGRALSIQAAVDLAMESEEPERAPTRRKRS
jgi:tetratricopeptide (TPR) repeat protein